VRYLALYLTGRLAAFVVALGVLYLIGLRSFYLLLAALALSVPLSVFALRRPRHALAADIEQRVERKRSRQRNLRAALRGDEES
jgi:hypothetical protein